MVLPPMKEVCAPHAMSERESVCLCVCVCERERERERERESVWGRERETAKWVSVPADAGDFSIRAPHPTVQLLREVCQEGERECVYVFVCV